VNKKASKLIGTDWLNRLRIEQLRAKLSRWGLSTWKCHQASGKEQQSKMR